MGQQQLLLIVVGVIIVGLAIVLVIDLFQANALEANQNAVYSDSVNLVGVVQHYYQLPKMLSGGGGSFVGFTLPVGLSETGNGTYSVSNITAETITINGLGNEHNNEGQSYHITIVVDANSILSSTSVLQ